MNKLTVLVISLVLFACSNHRDLRPDIYSKGDRLLSRGVIDYKNDDYPAAQQNFYRALMLYLSIDETQRSQFARINLVESLLKLSNFDAAEEQITLLKQQAAFGLIDKTLSDRIVMLEVKYLFKKQQYDEALAVIEPLLARIEELDSRDSQRLEWLATAARLETLTTVGTKRQWLRRFQKALAGEPKQQLKFQVLLKRIDAIIAMQNKQYPEALKLLHEALSYYREQVDRGAIAACLEEIAELEFKQYHRSHALEFLKRALTIRIWLKDQHHIDKIQKRMEQINHPY